MFRKHFLHDKVIVKFVYKLKYIFQHLVVVLVLFKELDHRVYVLTLLYLELVQVHPNNARDDTPVLVDQLYVIVLLRNNKFRECVLEFGKGLLIYIVSVYRMLPYPVHPF